MPSSEKEQKKSRERMRTAFARMFDRIRDDLDGIATLEDKADRITNLFNAFADQFSVLYVEATDQTEAYTIFETLNARGKNLDTADLLKNYIFSHVESDQVKRAQQNWKNMTKTLGNDIKIETYIRHFWNSCHAIARTRALYREIVKSTKTKDDAFDLLEKLSRNASIYHDLCFPDRPVVIDDANLLRHLRNIAAMRAKAFFPIMLALYQCGQTYKPKDIVRVANAIENLIFRNSTICGRTANSMETLMCRIALAISGQKYMDVDSICTDVLKLSVSDEEFRTAFEGWKSLNKEQIRYALRMLNKYYDPNNELSVDNQNVHIEHIMPENNDIWKIAEKDHKTYLWRLGNLTLLSGKLNKSISNGKFTGKMEKAYRQSKIELNKTVRLTPDGKERREWGVKDIETRQKQLAEAALEVWKVK